MITRLFTLLLLLPAAAFAAALGIEFNGVVVEGNKIQVSLLNANTGTAKWVTVGGKFDNYIVTSCNVLDLLPGGQPVQNPTVVLTNAATKVATPILIKSSQILSTPTPGVQPAGPTVTTVTMGPNGPTVSVGPGPADGPPPNPGAGPGPAAPTPAPTPTPTPTTAPAPPPPPARGG